MDAEVLGTGQTVGVANVKKVLLKMMNHQLDEVRLTKMGLEGISQTQIRQVDVRVLKLGQRVGFSNVAVLWKMMNHYLHNVHLDFAKGIFQIQMSPVNALRLVGLENIPQAQTSQVEVDLEEVTFLRKLMNYQLHYVRLTRGLGNVTILLWNQKVMN